MQAVLGVHPKCFIGKLVDGILINYISLNSVGYNQKHTYMHRGTCMAGVAGIVDYANLTGSYILHEGRVPHEIVKLYGSLGFRCGSFTTDGAKRGKRRLIGFAFDIKVYTIGVR